ncbi:dTDP-glucose 4,6-dehydratase [Planctomycetales bacterium ZRK34]|nr:dTDP-glucose 4,6-dehydratase [Planctomycetales bacterium ZRK34]
MGKTLLVTGGAGFIGSNFIRLVIEQRDDWHVINLDALTYSGNLENLADIDLNSRYEFARGDINNSELLDTLMPRCDAVVHFAAESHVDRSIMDSTPFVQTNVVGTQKLLDAARRNDVQRFVHVSTDEVYGELPLDDPEAKFTEQTPIAPNSPYSASKAASDLLVRAYHETFGMDTLITRCSNNFGPYQFPEKVIPLFVSNLLEDKQVPLYGDGLNVRDWIHVVDHCEAVLTVLEKGSAGEVYNIGGNNERTNLELTHSILKIMGKDESMIKHVTDRLGHDRRYAIDATKMRQQLGWEPTRSAWPNALEQTVQWYVDHTEWWQRVKSGAYAEYYDKMYGNR